MGDNRARRRTTTVALMATTVLAGMTAAPGQAVSTTSAVRGGRTADVAAAAALPDNGRIAYGRVVATHGERRVDIVTVRADGRGQKRLTRGGRSAEPVWSPDGSRIAFLRDLSDDGTFSCETGCALVVMGAGGKDRRVVASGARLGDVAWSPDGASLAFSRWSASSLDLWVVDVAAGDAEEIAGGDGNQQLPAWSPDGELLAFQEDGFIGSAGGDYAAWVSVHSVASGTTTPITPDNSAAAGPHAGQPSWSPDGTRLAVTQFLDFEFGTFVLSFDVAVVDADGSDYARITDRPSNRDLEHPVWRPQGDRILFTRGFHGDSSLPSFADALVTIAPDGTGRQVVARGGERWADWSPDGRFVLAIRDRDNGAGADNKRPGLWVMRADGSRAHRLVRGGQFLGADWQPR